MIDNMKTYNHFKKLFSVAQQKGLREALNYDIDSTLSHSRIFAIETGFLAGFLYYGFIGRPLNGFHGPEQRFSSESKPQEPISKTKETSGSRRLLRYFQPSYYL